MKALPKNIRQARAFLYQRKIHAKVVAPRRFAAAAQETGKSFGDLLGDIGRMYLGGQGQGQFPETAAVLRGTRK